MSTVPIATPEREHNHVVRERIYSPSQLEHVLLMVHEERFTGVVMLDCNQGGLCSIRLEERRLEKGGQS